MSDVERERGEVSRDARHLSRRRASVALGFDHADAGPGVVRVVSVPGFEPVTSARAHAAARVAAWRKRREARAYERHFRTARGPGHAPSAAKRVARANETSADAKSPESNAAIPEEIHSRVGACAGSTVVSGAGGGGEDRGAGGGGGEDRGAGGAGGGGAGAPGRRGRRR